MKVEQVWGEGMTIICPGFRLLSYTKTWMIGSPRKVKLILAETS